jgi:hypothetical protein
MAYLVEEFAEPYEVFVEGKMLPACAFGRAKRVGFPAPVRTRRAYTMPFRDQLYYPNTLGARTSIARLALDPPWLGSAISLITKLGGRALLRRGTARDRIYRLTEALRRRYAQLDQFALVVEVRAGDRVVRSSLIGRQQAQATAVGVAAIAEALYTDGEILPGVWLAEQVVDPARFLARLAARGLKPVTEEFTTASVRVAGGSGYLTPDGVR